MKIVTWNCNGALMKKLERISYFNADIYIIQGCEDPSRTNDIVYQEWSDNYLWIGDSENNGLGIFPKPNVALELLDWSNLYKDHSVKYFSPCQ